MVPSAAYVAIPLEGEASCAATFYSPADDEFDASSIIEGSSFERSQQSESFGARRPFLVPTKLLQKLQNHALILGIFVGFFVECGALSAHVLFQGQGSTMSYQQTASKYTQTQIMLLSFAWALSASFLPCLALFSIRRILFASHGMMSMAKNGHMSSLHYRFHTRNEERCLKALGWHLECRFGMGSFVGVTTSVALVDTILGLSQHLIMNIVLFLILSTGFVLVQSARRQEMVEVMDDDEEGDEHEQQVPCHNMEMMELTPLYV